MSACPHEVSENLAKFWFLKSNSDSKRERQHTLAYVEPLLNGHATVVGGHATVTRPSNNVSWMFQAIWKFFEKSHWTVTRQ